MLFEKAVKLKLRFDTNRGQVTSEDLFDMPLVSTTNFSLDVLAQTLNKEVKESAEQSFVVKKNKANKVLELKFEIVKRVIEIKLEEKAVAEKLATDKAKKGRILEILADKEDEGLRDLSSKQLKKMAKSL